MKRVKPQEKRFYVVGGPTPDPEGPYLEMIYNDGFNVGGFAAAWPGGAVTVASTVRIKEGRCVPLSATCSMLRRGRLRLAPGLGQLLSAGDLLVILRDTLERWGQCSRAMATDVARFALYTWTFDTFPWDKGYSPGFGIVSAPLFVALAEVCYRGLTVADPGQAARDYARLGWATLIFQNPEDVLRVNFNTPWVTYEGKATTTGALPRAYGWEIAPKLRALLLRYRLGNYHVLLEKNGFEAGVLRAIGG